MTEPPGVTPLSLPGMTGAACGMEFITEYLDHWAEIQPERVLYRFIAVDGALKASLTYRAVSLRTRNLAAWLARTAGLRRGERVLLVYPPGLEIVVALLACARLGVIGVPVAPPVASAIAACLARAAFAARDCQAVAGLTTASLCRQLREGGDHSDAEADAFARQLRWIPTDGIGQPDAADFRDDPNPILFLQYTSGSTSDPKGVIVTHRTLQHNARGTVDHVPTGVCWLPQHHDMGLIGYYLFPLATGGTTIGFSPLDFLRRPRLWLETISRYRATFSSAPNFAFDYCLREDKIPSSDLDGIDLTSLRVLMNAAEPARAETYTAFAEKFAACGLQPQAHVVAYGLAENTLAVTNHGRRSIAVDSTRLRAGVAAAARTGSATDRQTRLMSCGRPIDGVGVRIVDQASGIALSERQVGEVWVSGSSICPGYWARPELTRAIFHAAISDDTPDRDTYLRTGDLGFLLEGELFVCGRIKDVIIIHGVNHYPQEIEQTVEVASPVIRRGGVAAFEGAGADEKLVVVIEAHPGALPDISAVINAIRTRCGVAPDVVAVVPLRTIDRTTSGKMAHNRTRERWLDGTLPVIAVTRAAVVRQRGSGAAERLQVILDSCGLTGDETISFAECGIDSLSLVMLIEDVERLFREHGADELIEQVDTRLIQDMSVATFCSLVETFDTAPERAVTALRGLLRKTRSEQDRLEQACMRADASLERLPCRAEPLAPAAASDILMTGATGFFGPFLLAGVLQRTRLACHVLIRAADPAHGMARIRDGLRQANLLTADVESALATRVHVIPGDISRPMLGLEPQVWNDLAARTDAVLHNAALVNYLLNYHSLRPHNVEGTRTLLRFAATGQRKAFHLISSTIIFGWTTSPVLLESDTNDGMANLDFGYSQTKWVAEQLALAAARQGLPVSIYRPSFITAAADGIASQDDIVIRLLAFMINHGLAVNARNQASFLPADVMAANIAAIIGDGGSPGQTLHLTVDAYNNIVDVTKIITRIYGYRFRYYAIPEFVSEMKRRCTRNDLLYPLVDFFVRAWRKLEAMEAKRYNNDRYRTARSASGNHVAEPALEETVSRLMSYMLRERLIPPPPRRQPLPDDGQFRQVYAT
jgi:thioester reductase-like protein